VSQGSYNVIKHIYTGLYITGTSGSFDVSDTNSFYDNGTAVIAYDTVVTTMSPLLSGRQRGVGVLERGMTVAASHPIQSGGDYRPNAGSPLIGAGANLTSLGIGALNSDYAGSARPAVGAWTSVLMCMVSSHLRFGDWYPSNRCNLQ